MDTLIVVVIVALATTWGVRRLAGRGRPSPGPDPCAGCCGCSAQSARAAKPEEPER